MKLDEYQLQAESFAIFTKRMYPVVSLMVESAELADLFVKPVLRGDDVPVSRDRLVSEAGDVLWNLAVLLKRENIHLEEVAEANLNKLSRRKTNGTIQGSGER